jgi:hypothetical protein
VALYFKYQKKKSMPTNEVIHTERPGRFACNFCTNDRKQKELAPEELPVHAGTVHEYFAATSTVFIPCPRYEITGLKHVGLQYE